MYLKSLEISGFKSFAKKSGLEFKTSITGIVGPNGSGKSNIAEAFRFVLGEQSIKSLRGKRGEDLIWNGGGEAGRANRGSVKLVFDNSRKLFNTIDFDEVSVERAVHRDSSNEYFLNGSLVRLKDVIELMAGAHIGATGHHIISQGEADRILSASIRERREMIEDALGLKIYQWKKLESIRKLERTDENMKQVESLRREIAPHLKFLKKQVEKVEKAEQLRKDLIQVSREFFSIEDEYIKAEKTKLVSDSLGPKKELADLDRELEHSRKILTDSKNKDTKSDKLLTLEDKLGEIRTEKDAILRELGRLDGEISANERVIQKEKEKSKREEFQTVYLKDVEGVIVSIEQLSTISDVKKLLGEVVLRLRSFVSKYKNSGDSATIGYAEVEIKKLSQDRTRMGTMMSECSKLEAESVREYSALKSSIEKEKDTNRDAEKDVFRIIARQNEVRNVLAAINSRAVALQAIEERFKRELGEVGIIGGREAVDYSAVNSVASNSRSDQENRMKSIEKFKIRLEDAGASGGSEVLKEFRETEERDAYLAKELEDLDKARVELLKLIADLDARIDLEFKSGILKINAEFSKFFTLMFGGGKAELTVVKEMKRRKKSDMEDLNSSSGDIDIEDPQLEEEGPEGLEVNVNLPRKKVKGLMMLSGGERALTSIALLFAISQVNPPPFIILDETDAALDEANSRKYGDMIESLSKHSQLILITHNRETMSRAGVLYGVTMGSDGASKLLSIQFEDAVKVAK